MPRLGPLEAAMSGAGGPLVENVTVLMEAAEAADRSRVKELLASNRVDTADRDSTGKTALHYGADSGSRELIALLLEADHSVLDATDNEGYTPLHLAVIAGNGPAVEFLVEKGADVNRVDGSKHSVVHWATVTGHIDILQFLLRKQALPSTPDLFGAHALHYATQLCGGTEARLGKETLRLLLKHGANMNCGDHEERTPMLWAACSGGREAVVLLLEGGAEKSTVDKDGLSALHCAASRGHSHIISTLLQSSPDYPVDPKDRNGFTPLVYAVSLGHIDCARLLLQNSAAANHQDKKLRSPAHCGAAKGQLGTLKLLQQHGGSLQMENRRGDLPLHEAVHAGNLELVRWLISVHPETAAVGNYEGRTTLHLAAAAGDDEMMAFLLDKGAGLDALMLHHGSLRTPLDLATERGETAAARWLADHGAHSAEELPAAELERARKHLQIKAQKAQEKGAEWSSDESRRRGGRRVNSEKGPRKPRKDSKRRHSSKKGDAKGSPKRGDSDDTDQTILPASSTTEETQTAFIPEYLHPQPLRINFGGLGSGTERSEGYPSISSTAQLRLNGRGTKGRYSEEKRIFQELASLKRMQIQYGKVQEEVLVQRLVDTYSKGHHFIPSDFQFDTFNSWEKFLYDQLKHLYHEERDAIDRQARAEEASTDRSFLTGTRPRFVRPGGRENARVDRLLKTYGVAPVPLNRPPKQSNGRKH